MATGPVSESHFLFVHWAQNTHVLVWAHEQRLWLLPRLLRFSSQNIWIEEPLGRTPDKYNLSLFAWDAVEYSA